MEISQQQMVMAIAVQSGCLSLVERIRTMIEQKQDPPETLVLLHRAGALSALQFTMLNHGLLVLARAHPRPSSQTIALRFMGLTQQAYSMVTQLNLDRRTTALGQRSAPQAPQEQLHLLMELALDTWEMEIIGGMQRLSDRLEED